MTHAGWILSALAPEHRQTLPELLNRLPSTLPPAETRRLLTDLVRAGKATEHAPDGEHAATTYTRAVTL